MQRARTEKSSVLFHDRHRLHSRRKKLECRSVVTGQGSDHVRPCEALGRDLLCSITPCSLQWAAIVGDFPRKTTAKLQHLLNLHVLLVVVLPDKVIFWSNFASSNCYCSRNFAICVSVSNKKMKFY